MVSSNITDFLRNHISKYQDAGPVAAMAIAMAISRYFSRQVGWCHIHILLLVQHIHPKHVILVSLLDIAKRNQMVGGVSNVAMKMLQSLLSQSMQQVMDQFWTARRRASKTTSLLCSVMWEPWLSPTWQPEEQWDSTIFPWQSEEIDMQRYKDDIDHMRLQRSDKSDRIW